MAVSSAFKRSGLAGIFSTPDSAVQADDRAVAAGVYPLGIAVTADNNLLLSNMANLVLDIDTRLVWNANIDFSKEILVEWLETGISSVVHVISNTVTIPSAESLLVEWFGTTQLDAAISIQLEYLLSASSSQSFNFDPTLLIDANNTLNLDYFQSLIEIALSLNYDNQIAISTDFILLLGMLLQSRSSTTINLGNLEELVANKQIVLSNYGFVAVDNLALISFLESTGELDKQILFNWLETSGASSHTELLAYTNIVLIPKVIPLEFEVNSLYKDNTVTVFYMSPRKETFKKL